VRIGDLARESGASVRSLRYYEEQGLLHAVRTTSGQRTYTEDAVERVRMLRRLYTAGLTSSTIAVLLPCVDSPSAATTRQTVAMMRHEHERLGEEIADLVRTREQLAALIEGAAAHGERQELEAAADAA
jgi:DNA-binding transcriptional MerR regulator